MEACYAAELLLPLFVSLAHTQGLPASPASDPSPQPVPRKHLPTNGAFSDCEVQGFPTSSHFTRKDLPRAASHCHASSSSSSSSSSSTPWQVTSNHWPRNLPLDNQVHCSSSSPTSVRKHFPRAFSDCPSSLSSSTQHVKRRCLRRAFSDFQVQCFPFSSSVQHVGTNHLPRAFSDFQVSSLSPSSTTQNVKTKHLPSIFADYEIQGFSSLLSRRHSRRMHLSRAFSNCHGHIGFVFAKERQPPSVRTRASVGRLSGAVHGSNSRKGRHRKRYDIEQEGNYQELENPHVKEFGGEPISEDSDCHLFCDDVPYDKDSECDTSCENAPCFDTNSTGSLLSNTCMYDSIHGDFWQMDPYYQEFENSESDTPKSRNDIDTVTDKNCLKILDVGNSQDLECLVEVQGGNGTPIAYERMDISESQTLFPATAAEGSSSLSCKDSWDSVKKRFSLNSVDRDRLQGFTGTETDSEKSLSEQNERGKDIARDVGGGERLSTSLGSLQNIEGIYVESRQCSGDGKVDARNIEWRSSIEAGVIGSIEGNSTGSAKIAEESGGLVIDVTAHNDPQTLPVVQQVGQVVEQMADFLPDSIKDQVVNVVDQVERLPVLVSQVAEQVIVKVVDQLPDPVVEQAGQVADQVTQTAEQIVEQVATQVVEPINSTASQLVNFLSSDEEDMESDDEFEAYASLDIPEFKGREGLDNFTILQEEQGILSIIYDFYIFMLKRSSFEFMLGMFAAPVLLSMFFTILYLPEFSGLALDETIREYLQNSEASVKGGIPGLQLSWETVFQVFMFSVSLSTGLQPELAPLSPYTLVVANLNALFAQLIFVFLSGAVFARLSQPSQPVKCSTVAIICPPPSNRRLRKEACYMALLTRYVLVGPQPCELVDVKVDLTYNYNTVTRSGTYFRTSQSLKLVRPEIAYLTKGMLVRHIIDETSPLYQRTQGMLEKEDAVFSLSVVGLERSSMQSVFHVQHYCVHDKDVVWDAEFVDMILISKKNRRVVDHSLLSNWRPVTPR